MHPFCHAEWAQHYHSKYPGPGLPSLRTSYFLLVTRHFTDLYCPAIYHHHKDELPRTE